MDKESTHKGSAAEAPGASGDAGSQAAPAHAGDGHAPPAPSAVIPPELKTLDGGSGDLLAELVALFLEEGKTAVEQLRHAVAGGDFEAIAGLAHSLKGSSQTLGAGAVARLCTVLERRATGHDSEGIAVLLDDLAGEVERTAVPLQQQVPPGTGEAISLPERGRRRQTARNRPFSVTRSTDRTR